MDNWEALISDPDERRVFNALNDPEWDYRSIASLSSTTGLPRDQIHNILASHEDLIRRDFVPGHENEELYTLTSKKHAALKAVLSSIRAFITKST